MRVINTTVKKRKKSFKNNLILKRYIIHSKNIIIEIAIKIVQEKENFNKSMRHI